MAMEAIEDGPLGEEEEEIDDTKLALEGVHMMLNNGIQEARVLFEKYKDYSPSMNAGYSFITFMQAMMTFEDEKLAEAMKLLQQTQKKCELGEGFVKYMKRKFSRKKTEVKEATLSLEDKFTRQIIVADCMMHQAVLTFINQDISSYVKGGWLMRKAWKIYEKVYREIKALYDKESWPDANGGVALSAPPSAVDMSSFENSLDSKTGSDETGGSANIPHSDSRTSMSSMSSTGVSGVSGDLSKAELHGERLARLMGAVSFGYGLFQLCISLIPPKILKLIEFIGFEGNREVGLAAMEFSSHSSDAKAPLATLGLLWYHTVIRQFFALDGNNIHAGVEEGEKIIERIEKTYPNSALFLFYKGRVQRLKGDVDMSIATFQHALERCEGEREVQHICVYEMGWSNLMKLNWRDSFAAFTRMKEESRWSKAYYAYLSGVCQGSLGDVKGAHTMFREVPALVKRKNNQIESFVARRANTFKKQAPDQDHCILLGLEILYLWNALPLCTKDCLDKMMEECSKIEDKKLFHLRSLVEGALHKLSDNEEMAAVCFEEAIARHQGMKDDQHVAAFAMYELGIILIQKPETLANGKSYLLKAKDGFKEYDFENRLGVRIHLTLKRLKEGATS
ncbi:tetratricopeptide repeat protein 39C [Lingula anatina]|uniref:Tetratricopeptide repeat protein 39C n=1 Tax=Lingula anatina TaxID=7574 RepID=A0A1S3IL92_LINAN|nr:tetratricopeptide repeat protein 39C [Lingula anatina]|eukprot:XP_013398289.1 tetratricopeptide repeat protein 39C [Lingula anatina]